MIAAVQVGDAGVDLSQVGVVSGGGGGFGGLVVDHGAVHMAQFFHDGALVEVGAGEFLALAVVGAVPVQGAGDGAVVAGGNVLVGLVAGLGEQQVTVGAVTLAAQRRVADAHDDGQGAVGRGLHQVVGLDEPPVITRTPATARDQEYRYN